jgi:hypothetical protein
MLITFTRQVIGQVKNVTPLRNPLFNFIKVKITKTLARGLQ